jgi:recombination protein RecT
MTRRSATASFAPGAYVFPGGGIDAADAQATPSPRAARPDRPAPDAGHRRHPRELRGAGRAAGAPRRRQPATDADIAALDRHAPFAAQCRERGLTLAADQVFVLAHWITDRDLPRRFDVPFLVARMPEGQRRWPTRPSSSSRCGCARPTRWRATRPASSS